MTSIRNDINVEMTSIRNHLSVGSVLPEVLPAFRLHEEDGPPREEILAIDFLDQILPSVLPGSWHLYADPANQ